MTESGVSSTHLAQRVIGELIAHGVRDVVLCPGSRSAPLAYAVGAAEAAGHLRLWVRTDERVAGFVALGMGRAGHPAAVITTSGTAVANLHPAVLEASHSGIPLVVISADRPRELRQTWANQTTPYQARMFGDAVRARLDAATATDLDGVSALLTAALARTGQQRPGPVHLNLALSEPLVPQADSTDDVALNRHMSNPGPIRVGRRELLDHSSRTIVVAGDAAGPDAARLAAEAGWPLLAEPSSGSRGPEAIGAYRALLEEPGFGDAIERVVVFGRATLSRPVARLLARADIELVLITPYDDWPRPTRAARRIGMPTVEPDGFARSPAAQAWMRQWREANTAAERAIEDHLARGQELNGFVVARAIGASIGPDDLWQISASNPIRDLDLVGGTWPLQARVVANRGLSGIDGTISSAAGLALAKRQRVRCLVGDLAFLHDLGALLANPHEEPPQLQIVVLNDGGGGIFSLLEYGQLADRDAASAASFERLFGTPQAVDIASLCAGFGVRHAVANTRAELATWLGRADSEPGPQVLEVRVDRAGLRTRHEDLRQALRAAIG